MMMLFTLLLVDVSKTIFHRHAASLIEFKYSEGLEERCAQHLRIKTFKAAEKPIVRLENLF